MKTFFSFRRVYWSSIPSLKGCTTGLLLVLGMMWSGVEAQAQKGALELGIQGVSLGGDNGFGGAVGWSHKSDHFKIRLQADFNALQHLSTLSSGELTTITSPYQTFRLAFIGSGTLLDHIRLYGGGGPFAGTIGSISTRDIGWGFYGFWGFGFRAWETEFFLEAGGMGSLGNAEKILQQPLIATGFYISVGQRYFLFDN